MNIEKIENEIVLHGRKNNQAWFAPSIGIIPSTDVRKNPKIMVAVNQLIANDVGPLHFISTQDVGRTWTPPWESLQLGKIILEDDMFEAFGDTGYGLGLYYHRKTDTLLCIGHTVGMRDAGDEVSFKKEMYVPGWRGTLAYCVWDKRKKDFRPWERQPLPEKLAWLGRAVVAGCNQWHEAPDGTIYLPCTHAGEGQPPRVGALQCFFDGKTLTIVNSGRSVSTEIKGGVAEPSMVEFGGKYLMTIRSESGDFRMYHASSSDGLNWEDFLPWHWDDDTAVETENTQQHWLKHGGRLHLVYTRKSNLSQGVFRSRAPLWMAEVDAQTLRLIRSSEKIVFPAKNARMGNFCVANVTEKESWVMVGEWVEGMFPDKHKGMRFFVENSAINYIQYVGNLLLARIYWE